MSIILLIYLYKKLLDKDLDNKIYIYIIQEQESNNNFGLSINERISKIIFKIKEYYIICEQNKKDMKFNILETAVKNILVYNKFN